VLLLDVLTCFAGVVCDRLGVEVAERFIGEVCGALVLGTFVCFVAAEGDGLGVVDAIGILVWDLE